MKGAVFPGNREVELREFPDPEPGPGEVVLEIKASGMCGSDLHVYRSPGGGPAMAAALGLGGDGRPVIAGHEPCGVVVARGPEVAEKMAPTGARVMVHHYDGCGLCPACKDGWAQMCHEGGFTVYGITGDGAHAPYMKVPVNTLVALPDELSFAEGAAVSCGTGTAFAAIKRMQVPGGTTMAVFGQGPVGLSATLLGAAMGVRVIAADISPERLELARGFGADATVNAADVDTQEAILGLTHGRGADYTLECSAHPDARTAAVRSTRRWGTACFVGEGGEVTLEVSPDLLRRQLTLIGSWTFNTIRQDECARFVAENGIPLADLFTDRFTLDQAPAAYRKFDAQTMGKGVFEF